VILPPLALPGIRHQCRSPKALSPNISPGLARINTPAYFVSPPVTKKKNGFITLIPSSRRHCAAVAGLAVAAVVVAAAVVAAVVSVAVAAVARGSDSSARHIRLHPHFFSSGVSPVWTSCWGQCYKTLYGRKLNIFIIS
jgi:hypothetical protein